MVKEFEGELCTYIDPRGCLCPYSKHLSAPGSGIDWLVVYLDNEEWEAKEIENKKAGGVMVFYNTC